MANDTVIRDLMLYFAGHKGAEDTHSVGPTVRNNYVIHYVCEGKGYFVCKGRRHEVNKGQCFFMFRNVEVSYYPDLEKPWEYRWVDFSGDEAPKLLKLIDVDANHPVTDKVNDDIARLFYEIREHYIAQEPSQKIIAKGKLYELLGLLADSFLSEHSKNENWSLIDGAVSIMRNEYFNSSLTIESLAEKLSTTRVSLYRAFKAKYNSTPSEYLLDIRMQRAIELFQKTDISVKTVSYSVGFADPLYFSRVFRKKMGVSPKNYQNKLRSNKNE